MDDVTNVREELVERLDAMARLFEDIAGEAVDEGEIALAADLWVSSARVLAAADELWRAGVEPS